MNRDDSWQQGLRALLLQRRICFLATQGDHGPETSMAPYALYQGAVLLHLSGLARHTANIRQNKRIGLMICTPESEKTSNLALARLSLQGFIEPVAESEMDAARAAYVRSIPDAEPLFSFADFQLYRFTPDAVQWVGGFGKARKVTAGQWAMLCQNISNSAGEQADG